MHIARLLEMCLDLLGLFDYCPGHRILQTNKKSNVNTPGTAGGPGGRDRDQKTLEKSAFFVKNKNYLKKIFCIYLLVMPKYWGKQILAHGSFPEVGQKQKTEEK